MKTEFSFNTEILSSRSFSLCSGTIYDQLLKNLELQGIELFLRKKDSFFSKITKISTEPDKMRDDIKVCVKSKRSLAVL